MPLTLAIFGIMTTLGASLWFFTFTARRYGLWNRPSGYAPGPIIRLSVITLAFFIGAVVGIGTIYSSYTTMLTTQTHQKACLQLPRDEQQVCLSPALQTAQLPTVVQQMNVCKSLVTHSEEKSACFANIGRSAELAHASQ